MAYYFKSNTSKGDGSARCGETIRFALTLTDGNTTVGCPLFVWHWEADDGTVKDGTADGASGMLTIDTAVSIPGFIHLTVTACDAKGTPLEQYHPFEGGAGAEIDKIRHNLEEPKDFDAFWQTVLHRLDAVAPETLQFTEIPSTDEKFLHYDVRIRCGENAGWNANIKNRFDAPVSGYLTMPRDVREGKKYPLQLRFMGYSFTEAERPNIQGHLMFSVNPHGLPNGLTYEEYESIKEQTVGAFGFDNEQNTNPETVYFKGMILRDIQALRWAKALKEWDGKDIEIAGGSMGAFQTCAVASLCHEVNRINIFIPWLCDLGGILQGRMRGWRPDIEQDGKLLDGLRYYDTVFLGKRITCLVNLHAGLGDYICPPSGVSALYNALTCEKSLEWAQNRTHDYFVSEEEYGSPERFFHQGELHF